MQTIAPPRIGSRVCLKNNREAVGSVIDISMTAKVIEVDKGNDTFQRVQYHDVRIRWEDTAPLGIQDVVSCSLIKILSSLTAEEQVREIRESVRRRKNAYGSGYAANELFLMDTFLQEIIEILKR